MILIVLSLVLFSASLAVFQASKPKVYEYGVYKWGTPIATKEATVTINKITYNKGQQPFVASEGSQYIILDTTVQNTSGKAITVLPSTDTYIKDSDGRIWYLTPTGLEHPFPAGEIKAGDITTGELSYMVPTNKTYTMYIDAIWSGGVVSVRLN